MNKKNKGTQGTCVNVNLKADIDAQSYNGQRSDEITEEQIIEGNKQAIEWSKMSPREQRELGRRSDARFYAKQKDCNKSR